MPVIRKQTPQTKKSGPKKETVLDRIMPVSQDEDGISMSLYGRSGAGKTVFACTFPKPLLIVGFEKGTRSVRNVKGVDFIRVQDTNELEEIVEVVKSRYKTAVIDTATSMQDQILKEILGLEEIPVQKSWGMATQQQYGQRALQMKERIRRFLDLTESHKKNIVVISQEGSTVDDETPSDLIFPTVSCMLGKSVTGWLNPAADYVCQMFIREATSTKQVKIGNKVKTVREKTGKTEHCLRVATHPVYSIKFRAPLGTVIPECIPNPTYDKFIKLVTGEQ